MPDTPLNPDALAHARSAAFDCWESGGNMDDLAECAIEAYLAVAQPEVNSVEELDALPIGSVIMPLFHKDKSAILKDGNGDWAVSGHPRPYDTKTVFLVLHGKGARVLYHPEVNDA